MNQVKRSRRAGSAHMQITGFILLLAAGVIVLFGGDTSSGQTFPSVITPDMAGIRAN